MLTDLSTAAATADIMILPSGSRRRSWSETIAPRLRDQSGFVSSQGPRISSVAVPGKSIERIKINVSGKKYEITYSRLLKFPRSLLARSRRRAHFYDEEKDEFFFDRNRMAFESVYHFYQTAGEFLRPEHIPDDLLIREMQFFGLTEYLSRRTRESIVSITSPHRRKVLIPSNRCQRMVWELFENPGANVVARILNAFMLLLILLSVVVLCIETLPEFGNANMPTASRNVTADNQQTKVNHGLQSDHKVTDKSVPSELQELFIVEAFCVVCFTLELLIRFVVSPDKLRFFWNLLNIFDLLAVLPFYVAFAVSTTPSSLQSAYVLRVMRVMRVFRFAKIYRYSSAVQILVQTIRECLGDFMLLGFLILMTTVVFASCSYYFEQENESTDFVSIPAGCWWAVVTMSSVGYGDMVPVTVGGKISGALCVIFGVIIVTPLLPIIGSKFNRIQEKAKVEKTSQSIPDESSSESSELAGNVFVESLLTSSTQKGLSRPRSVTVH